MITKRPLAVGLIGCGFMAKAHSNAWRQAPRFFDLGTDVRMKVICGRRSQTAATKRAAAKLGWDNFETDWRDVVTDPAIDIVDICTPNDTHCEIAIAAARAGKAVLCEKPLARNVEEAAKMVSAVGKAQVANMVCFNYRRVPAVVLAKQLIDAGEIGRLFHFRARYAQDWIVDPSFPLVWRLQERTAGSGALGDIFSHTVDLARYLVGEFKEVCGGMETFVKRRPLKRSDRARRGKVTVDDAVSMIGRFRKSGLATLEATRFAPGRKNSLTFEINGSAGSLVFDLEEMNRLRFLSLRDAKVRQGFRDILVTEATHPYLQAWWPPGHIIGYEHSFVHTIVDFVQTVVTRAGKRRRTRRPSDETQSQPSFADAFQTQRVLDAVKQSAAERSWVKLGF